MKKLFKSIVTTGLIIAVCGTMSFVSKAAHGCSSSVGRNGSCAYYFLDADGDGICDNCGFGNYGAGARYGYGQMTSDGNGSYNTTTVLNETAHHSEHTNGYGYTGGQGHSNGHGHSGKHGCSR